MSKGKKGCMAKGGPTGEQMKAVGRNMARANNQASGKNTPTKLYSGGGQVRGTGAAVRGTQFKGVF